MSRTCPTCGHIIREDRVDAPKLWARIKPHYEKGQSGRKGSKDYRPSTVNEVPLNTVPAHADLVRELQKERNKWVTASRAEALLAFVNLDPHIDDLLI